MNQPDKRNRKEGQDHREAKIAQGKCQQLSVQARISRVTAEVGTD